MKDGLIFFQKFPRIFWFIKMIDDLQGSAWTHCGIIYIQDSLWLSFLGRWWVIESFPLLGVWTCPLWFAKLRLFWCDFEIRELPQATINHINFVEGAFKYFGKAYNYGFRWTDEQIYCSELIYDAYAAATGEPVCKLITVGSFPAEALAKWHDKIVSLQSGMMYDADQLIVTPQQLYEISNSVSV